MQTQPTLHKNKNTYRNYDRNRVNEETPKGDLANDTEFDSFVNMDREERENAEESETRTGRYFGIGTNGFDRPDETLYDDVFRALERSPDVDTSDVEIEVKDGVITLCGLVDTFEAKRMSERTVMKVPGVKDVANNLLIKNSFGGEF